MLGLILSAKNSTAQKILLYSCCSAKREIHSRNRKAAELIAKGWNALKEVDRVVDHTKYDDARLYPLLRTAKRNFELALETDNSNTHARYWLARLHLKYYVPQRCLAVGAALLREAADMGDPDAQFELALQLRGDNGGYVDASQEALKYLQKAVDQLHPGALYLMGTIHLTGDCVKKDVTSALWCFHRASEKGHPGAAIAYGALLLRGVEIPESITKLNSKKRPTKEAGMPPNPVELARKQFEVAARVGCDLGFRWLKRLEEEEKKLELSE
uniref:Binding protein n=1 Tax=Kalanchoe fedtschenkoi TaxID=63787 RepID=A0A7N0TP74_KALFE